MSVFTQTPAGRLRPSAAAGNPRGSAVATLVVAEGQVAAEDPVGAALLPALGAAARERPVGSVAAPAEVSQR